MTWRRALFPIVKRRPTAAVNLVVRISRAAYRLADWADSFEFVWVGWVNWNYFSFSRPEYKSSLRWWLQVGPLFLRRYR